VRDVVSERAFYIGNNDAEQLLVLNTGDEAVKVSEGQKVVVSGGLSVPRPQLLDKLSVSPEEESAIKEQEIFLRTQQITPQQG
jgi:hypothetical protein